MRRTKAMRSLGMSVYRPTRRRSAGYIASWRDPHSGKRRERTLAAPTAAIAHQAAQELADRIVRDIIEGVPWPEFCRQYEENRIATGRWKVGNDGRCPSRESWRRVKSWIEHNFPLDTIAMATDAWVGRVQVGLLAESISPNSLATYLARLKAALHWAVRKRMVDRMPDVEVRWQKVPRSRALVGEELDRILEKIPLVRPRDTAYWDRLVRGLSWSNLRIGELIHLCWDEDAPIHLTHVRHQGQSYPVIRMQPEAHKSGDDRYQVILREFWAVCCETPKRGRHGYVFPLPNGEGGQMTRKHVVRVIGQFGQRAGVLTNPKTGKCATSHDIGKRAFLPKIEQLPVALAHKAMGHAAFQTTIDHYDTRSAAEIAAKLWGDE